MIVTEAFKLAIKEHKLHNEPFCVIYNKLAEFATTEDGKNNRYEVCSKSALNVLYSSSHLNKFIYIIALIENGNANIYVKKNNLGQLVILTDEFCSIPTDIWLSIGD